MSITFEQVKASATTYVVTFNFCSAEHYMPITLNAALAQIETHTHKGRAVMRTKS